MPRVWHKIHDPGGGKRLGVVVTSYDQPEWALDGQLLGIGVPPSTHLTCSRKYLATLVNYRLEVSLPRRKAERLLGDAGGRGTAQFPPSLSLFSAVLEALPPTRGIPF